MPLGSVMKRRGTVSLGSKPTMRVEIPNGRTPPDWVYFCCTPATYLVMYSMVTGSSTVRRWDWHSTRALSMRIRPSAVRPGVSVSCKSVHTGKGDTDVVVKHSDLAHRPGVLELERRLLLHAENDTRLAAHTDLLSVLEEASQLTAAVPRFTASRAYSTWKSCLSVLVSARQLTCPSGEKTVRAGGSVWSSRGCGLGTHRGRRTSTWCSSDSTFWSRR